MEMYFLLTNSEDGTSINQFTKKELEEELKFDEDEGTIGIFSNYGFKKFVSFSEFDPEMDEGYGVLIKGEVIIPKTKKIVEQLSLEEE